ncbi:PREDICTED: uncharacterized protein LOC109587576 [Amphimedon queenslandica]|uniref:Uncharacterized protein n=1 Tax=Amphimedon queenslandica TaxID=400682 RepID=A0A1X7VNL7_AMPQE|nr:PREDICTED: uncharacterized protein LOC109587576 [Amphimedon queenslandica]|eukprot:XP_019859368.1 PREDICTED: uncharacterized protein LOC109587576 [Amphimedon queenslandica]
MYSVFTVASLPQQPYFTTMKLTILLMLSTLFIGNHEASHVTLSCEDNCIEMQFCTDIRMVEIDEEYYYKDIFTPGQNCIHYYTAPLSYQCYNSTSNQLFCNDTASFSNSKVCLNVSSYLAQFGNQSTLVLCLNSSSSMCSCYLKFNITITDSTCNTIDPSTSVSSPSESLEISPSSTSSPDTKTPTFSILPSTTSTPPPTTDGPDTPSPGGASTLKATGGMLMLLLLLSLFL